MNDESRPKAAPESATKTTTASVDAGSDDTHEARCRRCHRPLHTALAVAAGLGPICAMAAIARIPRRGRKPAALDQPALPIEAVNGR